MNDISKLNWYWNRLRCMSASEIAHRLERAISARLEQIGLGASATVPSSNFALGFRSFTGGGEGIHGDRYLAAADEILAGRLRVFAIVHETGATPRWNADPKSGRVAPLVFGRTIDYRNNVLVGDIKYLWEPNRHLHLVTLAQAWRLSRDEKYLDGLKRHVGSWLEQCPYPLGPNWTSSLELGIRLINWSIVWQLIGGHSASVFEGVEGRRLRDRWLASIYRHMRFIRRHLSKFSSANNHLIGEVAGLFVGTMTWPHWQVCGQWSRDARRVLEREALRQNGPDGVNLEQAVSYQQFVLDFLLLAGLTARMNGCDFTDKYWGRIELMLEYVASIMDVKGNVPMIGDADDGYVVRMSQEEGFCPYRSLIATGAVLFERRDFCAKAGKLDDKTRWLFGASADTLFQDLTSNGESFSVRRSFPDGGYYILGCDFDSDREIRSIVDAGPLGYLSIAAHGHADALAITLSVGGYEFLVDPGTYAYHTKKQWRDYFRGTAAHNTVEIDGENQSVSGGKFMWVRRANARCDRWVAGGTVDEFVGSHDGYQRLSDPVLHRREVVLEKRSRRFVVTDTLECKGSHSAKWHWHFAESCDVKIIGDALSAINGNRTVTLRLPVAATGFELLCGRTDPPAGWLSRKFDVKVPTTTAVLTIDISGTTSVVTEISCD